MRFFIGLLLALALGVMGCSETSGSAGDGGAGGGGVATDPGTAEWDPVPRDRVAEECGLDPEILDAVDEAFGFAWGVVRYGKLCHEYYPTGEDRAEQVMAVSKTFGALLTGTVAYQTEDFQRTGRKTGPLSDEDRVDHWLDSFDFNPDAKVAHVLAMVATNDDLGFGSRDFIYDVVGVDQINRLADVATLAIAQDPANLGENLEEFIQQFLFDPLGMKSSSWSEDGGSIGVGWSSTVRDMGRFGLLILNDGVWSGERVLEEEWIQKMTHPAFEDASTGYGYLTWLNSNSNYLLPYSTERHQGPQEPCSPAATWPEYPHGLSESPDCYYEAPWTCDQEYDVGVWAAGGLNANCIVGHPGLDMVLVSKNAGLDQPGCMSLIWPGMRSALIALDPTFAGDEEAFCEAYGSNAYAPDLRR